MFEEEEREDPLTLNQQIYLEISDRYEKAGDRVLACQEVGYIFLERKCRKVQLGIDLEARRN